MCRFNKLLLSLLTVFVFLNIGISLKDDLFLGNIAKAAPNKNISQIAIDGGGQHVHKFSWVINRSPTCTSTGSMSWKCSSCSYVQRTNTMSALGHQINIEYESVSAKQHVKIEDCTRCSYYKETAGNHELSEATCEKPSQCSICKSYIGQKLEHEYKWKILQFPTCTEAGSKQEYCTKCDKIKSTSSMKALGHDLNIEYESVSAKLHVRMEECKRCSYNKEIPENHNLSKATCQKLSQCSICKVYLGPKADHSFINEKCTVCGYKENICKEGNLLEGHNFEEIDYVSTSDGIEHITTYYCEICGIDSKFKKQERHELKGNECSKCFKSLDEGMVQQYYFNGNSADSVTANNGTVYNKEGKTKDKDDSNGAKYIEVSAFSAGANNLVKYIIDYEALADANAPNPVYMKIILIEPAIANSATGDAAVTKAVNEYVAKLRSIIPQKYSEYISIVIVVGEKGSDKRTATKTYNASLELCEILDGESIGTVELYGVNAEQEIDENGNVRYYVLDKQGNKHYCENIEYSETRGRDDKYHEDAQRAAVEEFGLGELN